MKQHIQTSDIVITHEFRRAIAMIRDSRRNVFVSGNAGTGKSTLLSLIRKMARKKTAVVAPTGVAALNVKGQTIHSFFKLPVGLVDLSRVKRLPDNRLYESLELLIIDEISMVRADIFAAIEQFLRMNGPSKGAPFGGVQLCVFGDLYQLPPIISGHEQEVFYQQYANPYFFASNAYAQADFMALNLTQSFRQHDQEFIAKLADIRIGQADSNTLAYFNDCVLKEGEEDTVPNPIRLTTTNKIAQITNQQALDALPGELYTYEAKISGNFPAREGQIPAPMMLQLKEGAQVMMIRNDLKKRWVNGTIGTISYLDDEVVELSLDKRGGPKRYVIEPQEWERITYHIDPLTQKIEEKVEGTFTQYPLIHAWAITIHKSQGKTLEHSIIDLGHRVFAPGQLYVALSRCRRKEHIHLKRPIRAYDVQIDTHVKRWVGQ